MSLHEFREYLKNSGVPKEIRFQPYAMNGGTVAAIAGDNYVHIASDTRLSINCSIYTRNQTKLFRLSDKAVLGVSGCWADSNTLVRILQMRIKMYEYEHRKTMALQAIAQMLATTLYYKRFFPYYVSNILAGLDNDGKGWVYSYDPIGHYEQSKCSACGTAEALLSPIMDSQISKKNWTNADTKPVPSEKSKKLLKDMFTSAAERDIYTGDDIKIMTINRNGIHEESFTLRKD